MEMNMPVMPSGFGGGGFGDTSNWIVFLIIAIIFGWGNGGVGGYGRNQAAENSFISNEFNYTNLSNGIRSIENGLCNLGDSILRTTAAQGESTRTAITNASFANERGLSALSREVADCCCTTNRNIDSVRYDMTRGFCDVINAGHNNTRDLMNNNNMNTQRIVDLITGNETQKLRDENFALKLQASQGAQSAALENTIQKYADIIIKHIPMLGLSK